MIKLLVISLFFLLSAGTYSKDVFRPVILDFKLKKYKKALSKLKTIKGKRKIKAKKNYYQGLCNARLKKFNKAKEYFKKAINLGVDNIDVHYELGQALYAANNIEESQKLFERSVKKKYKVPSSYYYLGYTSQVLELHKKAMGYFSKLYESTNVDKRMRQIGYYQYANSQLAVNEKNKNIKQMLKKEIIPTLKKARLVNKRGGLAKDIKKKISDLTIKYDLDPLVMKNGKKLKKKPWKLDLSQKLKYDSNITLQTDLPTTRVANIDSFIHSTSVTASYRFIHRRRLLITPKLKYDLSKHTNRDNSAVYQNDSYAFTFTPKFDILHKAFNKPSTLSLEYEYKYSARDRLAQKKSVFASRYTQYSIGENFSYFKIGPTTIKAKYKKLTSYTGDQDSRTRTLSINQIQILKSRHIMVYTFQADIASVSAPASSTSNFLYRIDYIIPKFWPGYSLNPNLSLAILDPREGEPTRGIEKTITPGLKLTRTINKKFKIVLGYNFQKKYSKDTSNYAYTKNDFLVDFKYKF